MGPSPPPKCGPSGLKGGARRDHIVHEDDAFPVVRVPSGARIESVGVGQGLESVPPAQAGQRGPMSGADEERRWSHSRHGAPPLGEQGALVVSPLTLLSAVQGNGDNRPLFRVWPQRHRGFLCHGLAQRPAKAGPATVLESVHGPAFTAVLSRRPPRPATYVIQAASEPVLRLGEISAQGESTGAAPFSFLPFQDCVAGCTPQRDDRRGDFVKQAGKEGGSIPSKWRQAEAPASCRIAGAALSLRT